MRRSRFSEEQIIGYGATIWMARWLIFDFCHKPHSKRIKHLNSAIKRNTVVFIPLIA